VFQLAVCSLFASLSFFYLVLSNSLFLDEMRLWNEINLEFMLELILITLITSELIMTMSSCYQHMLYNNNTTRIDKNLARINDNIFAKLTNKLINKFWLNLFATNNKLNHRLQKGKRKHSKNV
jgi:hypothetical protein